MANKNVQFKLPDQNELKNIKHVIMVMSGKGGVGKSTIAVNLSVALALEGRKVGLMDIDMHGPNVMRMLGGTEKDHPYQVGEKIVPPEVNGVKVISVSQFVPESGKPIVWRGPIKTGTIKQFFNDIEWEELDYMIIDAPPGTGDEPLTVMQMLKKFDGAIIVTTPSEVSKDDVERAINFFKVMDKKVLGLVENMAYFECPNCHTKHYIFGKDGAKSLAEKYKLPILAEIPISEDIRINMDTGKPAAYFGKPEHVAPYVQLAKRVIAEVEKDDKE
ncbi:MULTISPECIES: Mrp/NBP35 family ATP-binding protein [unclassified Marinitoga]|uniref:Mrp/NBP35 family ATP-binding protein n=1 Tax=unclassified Marinitoga TaxID=2640159 RepID=UPI000641365E|nr:MULTISPECIES: Mrp/NBP35 family ATP-binding protein [unclassified Marinitoga]KLO24550.1 ATP-binding protein [Marinitoga sp. 1155]NUU99399.1 ATP-binding protein [Marinitoga sp. 1154]